MNDNKKEIIIIGGGGFALEVYSYIRDDKKFIVKGVIDETKECELLKKQNDLEYLGKIDDFKSGENDFGIISIGNATIRRKLYLACKNKNLKLCSYFHSSSYYIHLCL